MKWKKKPLNHNDVKIDFNRALSLLVYTYTDLKLSAKKVLVHQPRFAHKHLPLTQITTNQLQTTINGIIVRDGGQKASALMKLTIK